ncbi:DUF4902 domain-containing protein [Nitrogeniibacter aestuarii]|uniref:DUF4902 domain-containing protein n=1 Tax=Nitrogeniibacter aestuarii TaxID=2815343 RepID=UPI001D1146DC|nr:DUF4902 domain-containing protein [Nitrogeniibacter aestuarii]
MRTEHPLESVVRVSDDGFVRLSEQDLSTVRLRHFVSGLDAPETAAIPGCGDVTEVTGFTEWIAGRRPYISLGWDWVLDVSHGHTSLKRTGEPRTNVMLVDGHTRDLGMDASLRRLAALVDDMAWSTTVWPSIVQRYGGPG